MVSRVLITTDYLRPDDEVDRYLRQAGHETAHLPMRGRRDPEELAEALRGAEAALIANEPMTAGVLARAFGMTVLCSTNVPAGERPDESARVSDRSGGPAPTVEPSGESVRFSEPSGESVRLVERSGESVRFVELDELLADSDYVSVHTALTERTRGLLGEAAFRRMKPGAVLVNTARGPIVDERALADAVRSSEIAGAALDVVCVEPLPPDSPLRDVDGIVVYSHLAGQSAEARRAAGLAGAAELVASLKGAPRFAITLPATPRTAPVPA
ncbi:NAD(P)-dependent oxidoreductase [Nonomuraea sp. NPDC050643]|uniref:NAD(P)-dependent oxidoreductase n=1 Tax=Nonomuraea sp. NPDC050643 TaxID=3155660 RepID=UPI0033D52369